MTAVTKINAQLVKIAYLLIIHYKAINYHKSFLLLLLHQAITALIPWIIFKSKATLDRFSYSFIVYYEVENLKTCAYKLGHLNCLKICIMFTSYSQCVHILHLQNQSNFYYLSPN